MWYIFAGERAKACGAGRCQIFAWSLPVPLNPELCTLSRSTYLAHADRSLLVGRCPMLSGSSGICWRYRPLLACKSVHTVLSGSCCTWKQEAKGNKRTGCEAC